jgi:ADP-heptose:LPS heptosyltransferase
MTIPYGDGAALHAAEDVFRLGAPLGIGGPPGPCRLAPNAVHAERLRVALTARGWQDRRVVAIHISARRPAQRWPAERFAQVISALGRAGDLAFLLLWSPGAADDPRHPGDDDKAAAVAALAGAAPLLAWPTATLAELNGALAVAHLMICADGGAMHVAVGLGVRVVALFGDSPVTRWRPWGRGHEVVRGPADSVDGIAAERVVAAAIGLLGAR